MGFQNYGFQSLGVMGTPDGAAGSRRQIHTYITPDAPATVETADYFLSIYQKLHANDVLLVSYVGAVNRLRTYLLNTVGAGGVTIKREDDPDATGSGARAVVATAAGLTTGLILDSDSFVDITNGGDANNWSTLPAASAATRGREIWLYANGGNSELRTPATGNDTINNVDCGAGAKEALLTSGRTYIARQHLATGWLLQEFSNLGAVGTAIVPD